MIITVLVLAVAVDVVCLNANKMRILMHKKSEFEHLKWAKF